MADDDATPERSLDMAALEEQAAAPPVQPDDAAQPSVDESDSDAAGGEAWPSDDPAEAVVRADRRRRTAMIAGGGIVAVTLIALGGLAGWFGHRIGQENHVEDRREFLIGVARQAAVNLTTIDYSNVDADIKRILDSSTGTFHDDFDHRSAPFIQAVTQAQSKSQGTVTEAGLESEDGSEAQVLLAVSVRTSVHGNAEQQPRAWRMRITVASNGDRDAKVSNVQFVP